MLSDYARAGWALVRIPPLTKAPLDLNWPTIDYRPEDFAPGDNVGVKLGAPSGNLVDIDCDCPEAIALAPLFLPPTATFGRYGLTKTPPAVHGLGCGVTRHYLYTCAGQRTQKFKAAHLEIRGTGGQTVIPPSIRGIANDDPPGETEQPIFWTSSIPVQPITEADLFRVVGMLGAATVIARAWPKLEGGRHDACLALAGALHGEGWSQGDAELVILSAASLSSPDPGHRAAAIRDTWDDTGRNRTGWPTVAELMGDAAKGLQRMVTLVPKGRVEAVTVGPAPELGALTDAGNAERLAAMFGPGLRYVAGIGWHRWDGSRWKPGAAPIHEALVATRSLAGMARTAGLKKIADFALASEASGKLEAACKIASYLPALRCEVDEMDADPWLLNTPGGTLELRTGLLREHRQADLITQVTNVTPGGTCPRFISFLGECFSGDLELVTYLLRFLGYCLTGSTEEHILAMWHGPSGANGKTTLLSLLLHVLGDYACVLSPDVLMAAAGNSHPTALMDLRGRRLVGSDETPEGRRWNESLVKRLSGGGRMRARGIAKDSVEFTMTHKLLIATNARPLVREQGSAFWRRMHCVPWMVSFQGREDPQLPKRLAAEGGGVLMALVAGLQDWLRLGGTCPPQAITAAGADYRASQDLIGEFLAEHTERDQAGFVSRTDLYRRYAHWAGQANEHVYPSSAFYRVLEERGLRLSVRNGTRGFVGLKFLVTDGLRVIAGAGIPCT